MPFTAIRAKIEALEAEFDTLLASKDHTMPRIGAAGLKCILAAKEIGELSAQDMSANIQTKISAARAVWRANQPVKT